MFVGAVVHLQCTVELPCALLVSLAIRLSSLTLGTWIKNDFILKSCSGGVGERRSGGSHLEHGAGGG